MSWFGKLLGGGLVKSIENVALEAIQTDKETAEANALWIKTLDPNGLMRRRLSTFACVAYGWYLFWMTALVFLTAFTDVAGAQQASTMMTGLFGEITTGWTVIVGASFGVNGVNSFKGN